MSNNEPIGKCLWCVDWSLDSMTSYSWRHNIQSRCIRKLWPDQLSIWML